MESLLPLVLLLGVMYFLLLRPQKQRAQAQRSLVNSLQVGDEVVTIGGLIGEIVALDDETANVETTVGTVLRYRRTAIAGRVSEGVGPTNDSDDTGRSVPGSDAT